MDAEVRTAEAQRAWTTWAAEAPRGAAMVDGELPPGWFWAGDRAASTANPLALSDLDGADQESLIVEVVDMFNDYGRTSEPSAEELARFEFLIAYCSVGDYGCDSSAWFLLREKATGKLYEVHGSHCSCMGFEGQWSPEETTLEYLASDKFYLGCGGYEADPNACKAAVKAYIGAMS